MTSCGGVIVKLILSVFNIIWMVAGSLIFYIGYRTMLFDDSGFKDLFEYNLKTGALFLVILGLAILVIAVIGFCGACCENASLLNLYGGIIFLLLVVNIVSLYYGRQYQDEFNIKLDTGIKNGMKNFDNDPKLAYALQSMQLTFHCCGWDGPTDYGIVTMPSSCCGEKVDKQKPIDRCAFVNLVYTNGCKKSPVIESVTSKLAYSFYSLILIQFIIILASCCLARDLRS